MKAKKLYFILAMVPVAFILLLIGLKFSLPGMLIALIALVLIVGIVYRKKPELFSDLKPEKKEQTNHYDTQHLSSEPMRHESDKKTYLELTSINASSGRNIVMDKTIYVIGRSSSCDCTLDNPEVTSRHVRLEYKESDKLCYAVDLGSTNFTLLNGVRLAKDTPKAMQQGDILQIANEAYQVEYAHF